MPVSWGSSAFSAPRVWMSFRTSWPMISRPRWLVWPRIDAVLLVHAEDPAVLAERPARPGALESRRYRSYLATRPDEAELESIRLLIRLARKTGGRVHIVHLSTARALGEIAEARRSGVRVSVETCPHYLHFAAEDVPDGATEFKCAPPIRSRENRELLWQGLVTGEIDLVASDHSPSPPELKCRDSGDFLNAWGGISSLPLTLPVVWTGARSRGVALEALPRWLSEGPARLAGLADRKGHLRAGRRRRSRGVGSRRCSHRPSRDAPDSSCAHSLRGPDALRPSRDDDSARSARLQASGFTASRRRDAVGAHPCPTSLSWSTWRRSAWVAWP